MSRGREAATVNLSVAVGAAYPVFRRRIAPLLRFRLRSDLLPVAKG